MANKGDGSMSTSNKSGEPEARSAGLTMRRLYTTEGVHPYDEVTWERRDVIQTNWRTGETVFEQRGVEFPKSWSMNATTIVTSKYFRGAHGTEQREWSLKQLIDRVVLTYVNAGLSHGYFATDADAEIFEHELTWMLLHQVFSFNSPVWFNVGTSNSQQISACFLLAVDDTMDSILDWYKEEGLIFKGGSGAGVNLSRIRSSKELLRSSGGNASGPVSFMRGADASAGTIKSGGATRRSAKMCVLDVDHPDIEEFIETKVREEEKIRVLRDAGFDMDLGGRDFISVQYQNANNSVRVTDEFMRAVEQGNDFGLTARTTGEVLQTVKAKELFRSMAEAAWKCADPGIQYDGTIQDWHTNPETGRITTSNPCFTGDTLIAVADGRNAVRIDQLAAEGAVDVYTKDDRGRTVVRRMKNIRRTRRDTELVRITFDDGTSVRCTPDHRFMLRDGTYVAAQHLILGASLKRFDSEVTTYGGSRSGSRRRRITGSRGWNWQHHVIAAHHFGQYRDGQGSWHLDHIDGDTLRDAPENLRILAKTDHQTKTVVENMAGDVNPARRMMTDEWRQSISGAMCGSGNPRYVDVRDSVLQDVYRLAVLNDPKAGQRQPYRAWNAYIRENGLLGHVPLARGDGRIRGMEWADFAAEMEPAPFNHAVVAVESAGFEDVYDGEVEETHNFAIITTPTTDPKFDSLSGVFVHNCSEYLSLDNSSCNLASLNLMKFLDEKGQFNIEEFVRATEIVITAMDISVSFGEFPTEKITKITRDYRQLGIGYTNLGALLMALGLPYDSDEGRDLSAAISSLMTAVSYRRSAELAGIVGPYEGYARNAAAHTRVMMKHAAANDSLHESAAVAHMIVAAAANEWTQCLNIGAKNGWRNAQASLLAPTGTISFMMDSDTTGVEPDFALVKFKKLVSGDSLKIVNQTVPLALRRLGYPEETIEAIVEHISNHGHVVNAPGLKQEHYAVFDCAVGERSIAPMGHVKMMAAVQPFLSGAISKTVNMPADATVEDVEEMYFQGWKLGLKALAIYRDNSKVGQPLSDGKAKDKEEEHPRPVRRRLPKQRPSQTYSFTVADAEGYMIAGSYPENGLGEIFLKLGKQGSTLAGVMDAFSIAVSIALQHGVPLEAFVSKFVNMKFDPAGLTDDPDIRLTQSVMDYIFRRLAIDYLPFDDRAALGIHTAAERARAVDTGSYDAPEAPAAPAPVTAAAHSTPELLETITGRSADAPLCMTCGIKMRIAGSCYCCESCGSTSGCS